MSYKSFDLLEKLYFVRTGGSKEELKAAEIIQAECQKLGVPAVLESFKVDGYVVHKAYVKFINPDIEVECVGVGMSSQTPVEGLTADFAYVTSLQDSLIQDNRKIAKVVIQKTLTS